MGTGKANSDLHPSRWPWMLACLVAISGITLSILLRHTRIALDRQAADKIFRAEALRMKDAVAQETSLSIEVLDSIRQLHAISDQISSEDFGEFVEKGMVYQRRILGVFGFIQRLDAVTRELLESSTPEPSLQIVELDPSGGFRLAGQREEYLPLTYQDPANGLGIPVGFDFLSIKEYRDAIERMARTGNSVLGGPALNSASPTSYYIFSPILYHTIHGIAIQPPGYLVGFTVALFQPALLLDRARGSVPVQGLDIHLLPPGAPATAATGSLFYEGTVRVADQDWIFRCEAGEAYLKVRASRQPDLILAVGLLITGLLTFELLLIAGRAQRTERLVRSRTRALHEAKLLLENEMAQRARLESEILDISNREKLRVGQDLHDSLGQNLAAATFMSRALAQKTANAETETSEDARKINALLKEAVAQVRRLARGLAPVDLSDAGLEDALQRLVTDAEEAYGIPCIFHAEGATEALPSKTAIQLYHIAQEALSNAARHGGPSRIEVRLTLHGHRGELVIEDDGAGLPEDAGINRGMGLQIMRHRATVIGGELDIHKRNGGGTRVVCRFDFPSPQQSDIG